MLEKRLVAVPPQLFTANGDTGGVGAITIATDACTLFKVKQKVFVVGTSLPTLALEIKQIDSTGLIWVGPLASPPMSATPTSPAKPAVPSSIIARTSVAAYTTAAASYIFADLQGRPNIDNGESTRAVYEEEPAVAIRSIMVDDCGDKYNSTNPFPTQVMYNDNTLVVNADGSINVDAQITFPPVTIPTNWTEIDMQYDSNNDLTQVQYYNGATLEKTLELTYDSNLNLTKVVAS